MGRSRWRSLFLGDPDATFLELFPHPGLRFAPTGVRELIHQGGQIEVSQGGRIRLTNAESGHSGEKYSKA